MTKQSTKKMGNKSPFKNWKTMGDRIKWTRQSKKWSMREAGERIGLSYQAIQQWESNSVDPRATRLAKFASDAEVDLIWILTGRGLPYQESDGFLPLYKRLGRSVPMLSADQIIDGYFLEQEIDYFAQSQVTSHTNCSIGSFAYTVMDNRNDPEIRLQDHIIVDTKAKAAPGEFALVVSLDQELIIGRYRPTKSKFSRKNFELTAENSYWPIFESNGSESGKFIGAIVEITRSLLSQ